jgi:cytochrome P450
LPKELGGDGENHTKTLKPFGGGNSYCPGHVFAEKQVMGFLAEICWRYEITILDKDRFRTTRTSTMQSSIRGLCLS